MKLILNRKLKPNLTHKKLQYKDDFFDMMDGVSCVVRYININVDFTTIGWYKRGVITDKIIVSQNGRRTGAGNNEDQMDAVKIDNSEVNFYFILIVLTD